MVFPAVSNNYIYYCDLVSSFLSSRSCVISLYLFNNILTYFKKLCLALCIFTFWKQISNHLELIKPNHKDDPDKQRKDAEFASAVFGPDIDLAGGNTQSESFMGLSDVKHCGKMRALEKLMLSWVLHGDKVLLFSYSVR